jgi:uncharacterized protein YecE (DUF72 family)
LLYGTAGWSYDDWVGPFYEAGTPKSDYLRRYAEEFPAVEVDSTYYRIPSPKMTANWARSTPDGFLFSPKMVGEVTHERFLEECEELVERYVEALSPLGEKLGTVILQFPYFRKAKGITLDVFLERLLPFLDALPDTPRFAVEVRNKPFLKPALLDALRERDTALVLVDHPWMPSPKGYGEIEGILTSDHVPIRLIGDRYGIEKITKSWGKVVLDRSSRLRGWASLVGEALADGKRLRVFANNHYAGHGPATIRELVRLLEEVGSLP